LLGSFSACQHDFWYPQAAAYAQAQWGDHDVSRTEWQGQHRLGEPPTHTTAARSLSLVEVCK
jgi:hypothetical protein